MAEREAKLVIEADDDTGHATESAGDNFDRLGRRLAKFDKSNDRVGKSLSKMGVRMEKIAQTGMRFGSRIAAGMSLAIAGTQAFLKAGLLTIKYGPKITGALVGIGASLAPLAIAYKFTALTFKLGSEQILKSVKPLSDGFTKAAVSANKLAFKGVRPVAQEFTKANLPFISFAMRSIADAAAGVVTDFLKWGSTKSGIKTIAVLMTQISAFVTQLRAPLSGVVQSFVAMSSRISGVALREWGDALSFVLGKLKQFMDSISSADVQKAFDDMNRLFQKGAAAARAFGDALQWIQQNQGTITQLRNALAGLAVVLGVLSGTWLPAIAGAITLLVGNWGLLNSAIQPIVAAFQAFSATYAPQIAAAIAFVSEGFAKFWAQVQPTLPPLLAELNRLWQELQPTIAALLPILGVIAKVLLGVLGAAVQGFILALTNTITAVRLVNAAFQGFIKAIVAVNVAFLNAIAGMLRAAADAAEALGMKSAADKLRTTAGKIEGQARRIQTAIDALHGTTITVTTVFKTVGNLPKVAGRANRRTAISLNTPQSFAASSWASALAGGGSSRTGGPAPVTVEGPTVNTRVYIDGAEVRAIARSTVMDENRRNAYRARVGRRS